MESVPGPLVNGKYLHWDELVRRTPPDELSHEQWWQALKFRRMGAHLLPLNDANGAPFKFMLLDYLQVQMHKFDFWGGGAVELPTQITNPETKDRYYISSLIEEAITSSQIEGASTTNQVARDMLRKGRPPRDTSERMILNNFLTMQHIGEIRKERLTPALVREIHRRVTVDTLDKPEQAGSLRGPEDNIYVADADAENVYIPPAAHMLPERLEQLCLFANGETPSHFIHPVIRAMVLHFWLAYDHPFVDSNGRTARALFYWSMLHHGYWLFGYVSISHTILRHRKRYDLAYLYSESDDNDLTYFLTFHAAMIEESLQVLRSYLAKKSAQVKEAERQLKSLAGLNHRQKALIAHALRHPHAEYTVASHRLSHGVTYETARTDLREVEARGLLLKQKQGKTFIYVPHPTLHNQLGGD